MISEISCFSYFPDGNWPPCWIFKSIKFYMQTWSGESTHITMPNFLEASLSILQFFKFSKWFLPRLCWIFEIAKFYWLTVSWRHRRITVPNLVKIGRLFAEIENFQSFKMAAAAILDFELAKFHWLFGWRRSRRISTSNFVKIGQSVEKVLRFFVFQDGGRHHIKLSNSRNFNGWRCLEIQTNHSTKFC